MQNKNDRNRSNCMGVEFSNFLSNLVISLSYLITEMYILGIGSINLADVSIDFTRF